MPKETADSNQIPQLHHLKSLFWSCCSLGVRAKGQSALLPIAATVERGHGSTGMVSSTPRKS